MTDTGPSRAPAWARALDAAIVAAAILFLFVLVFGGFAAYLGPLRLRIHTPSRLLFIVAALVAIRHVAHPGDPLHRRLARGLRARQEGSAASVVPAALLSRLTVLLVGYFAVITIGVPPSLVGF